MIDWESLEDLDVIQNQKPFFAIDLSNEEVVLTWLKQQLVSLKNQNTNYLERAKNNLLRYKGIQYQNRVFYPRDVLETQKKFSPQMVLPLLSDVADEKTARIMELKPAVAVIPMHDEARDKNDAKTAKRFLSHIETAQKLDYKYQKALKGSQIVGESFVWIRWNPDLGPAISLKNETLEDSQPVVTSVNLGDIEVVNKTAFWVFYEMAESWEKVNYCFVIELDYVDALKLDYPDKADKIVSDEEARVFDFETMESVVMKGMCRKIHFYHKRTKYLPQGYEACFVNAALLKHGPLSYEHGELPIERLVAVENEEELRGQSSFDKVRAIASNINNLLNSMVKMFMLAGYAKWFVEAGAVDDQSLNNDINIVKIKPGARPPTLAQANPVGAQHFSFVDKLREMFYQFAKSNSVVRGEPPPGVTAGVALQYVSESESRRLTTDVANFNAFVRAINDKILKTAAQYYKPGEERTMMLLGKDNRWENTPLDIGALKGPYNVVIQNTSGLSDSKAVRMQQVIDLGAQYPELFPREQVLEMTGLAQADKFYDVGSAAVRAAEDENEYIQDGKGPIEPAEYEDHVAHWRIHVQAMQAPGFKQKAPPEVQEAMKAHIMGTEYLMMEKAMRNPLYTQVLATLPGFPIYLSAPIPPPMPTVPPEMMEGGTGTQGAPAQETVVETAPEAMN